MPEYLLSVHTVEGEEMPTPDVIQDMITTVGPRSTPTSRPPATWVFAGGLRRPTSPPWSTAPAARS